MGALTKNCLGLLLLALTGCSNPELVEFREVLDADRRVLEHEFRTYSEDLLGFDVTIALVDLKLELCDGSVGKLLVSSPDVSFFASESDTFRIAAVNDFELWHYDGGTTCRPNFGTSGNSALSFKNLAQVIAFFEQFEKEISTWPHFGNCDVPKPPPTFYTTPRKH